MTTHDATEQAYRNGYRKAVEDLTDIFLLDIIAMRCSHCPAEEYCKQMRVEGKGCKDIFKEYLLKEAGNER